MPLDETGMVDASYGPAGMIAVGSEFAEVDRKLLGESIQKLELALTVLRGEDFEAWMSLVSPYLGDPADPGIIPHWRERLRRLDRENEAIRKENADRRKKGRPPKPERVGLMVPRELLERHDRAIEKLAAYLADEDLHAVFPKRMTSQAEEQIDRRNDEVFRVYKALRYGDGMGKTRAVRNAADHCGYSEDRVWKILKARGE
jgi:hypothetical protein